MSATQKLSRKRGWRKSEGSVTRSRQVSTKAAASLGLKPAYRPNAPKPRRGLPTEIADDKGRYHSRKAIDCYGWFDGHVGQKSTCLNHSRRAGKVVSRGEMSCASGRYRRHLPFCIVVLCHCGDSLRVKNHPYAKTAGSLARLGTKPDQCCSRCVWVGELSAHPLLATPRSRGEFMEHPGGV